MNQATKERYIPIGKLEQWIENAWERVKNDFEKTIWWKEIEIVVSFYCHLRPKIEKYEHIQMILEYDPFKTTHVKNFDKPIYPKIHRKTPESICPLIFAS